MRDKLHATGHAFMPVLWLNPGFVDALSSLKKNSLRKVIFLIVNSTLFNFPFDRMAIFSSAKDMTVLKVKWVTKWKVCELESHVGLSGGWGGAQDMGHTQQCLSNVSREGLGSFANMRGFF